RARAGYADRSRVWLARRMAPDRHPGCPGAPPANVRGHSTPITLRRGSGLVQPVFRSPARVPPAESTRKVLCAAPPSEKRYTLSREAGVELIPECKVAAAGRRLAYPHYAPGY